MTLETSTYSYTDNTSSSLFSIYPGTWTWDGITFIQPTGEPERKEKRMRGLYQVFVIDPQKGKVVLDQVVVATSAADAQVKAKVGAIVEGTDMELDDFDIIVCRLGDVREKERVQKVEIVGK